MSRVQSLYDTQVATLDDVGFREAAAAIVEALRSGEGLRMWFQPGDATRYLVEIGRRRTLTISNGEPTTLTFAPVAAATITFGTEGNLDTYAIGHVGLLRPKHGWTDAVWRRLWALTTELWT